MDPTVADVDEVAGSVGERAARVVAVYPVEVDDDVVGIFKYSDDFPVAFLPTVSTSMGSSLCNHAYSDERRPRVVPVVDFMEDEELTETAEAVREGPRLDRITGRV